MLWITCYNKITIRYVYQPLNNKEYKIEIIVIKRNEKDKIKRNKRNIFKRNIQKVKSKINYKSWTLKKFHTKNSKRQAACCN